MVCFQQGMTWSQPSSGCEGLSGDMACGQRGGVPVICPLAEASLSFPSSGCLGCLTHPSVCEED